MRKGYGIRCCEAEVCTAAISRERWLEHRRTGIGGSDAATVVGLNPWSSPYALYCDKTGALPPKEDNEAMRQGRDLEQYVATRWCERTGKRCRRDNTMWRSTLWPWMLADIDRAVLGENAGLECKTTSVHNRSDFEGGEIPLHYYVQCQHYMAVLGFDRMYLAVLVLNRGFYDFVIERDDAEIERLAAAEGAFWKHVLAGDPPPIDGSEATQEAIRRMHPRETQGLVLDLPRSVDADLDALDALLASRKEIDEQITLLKSDVMARMGEAPLAVTPTRKCSWSTRARRTVDASRLKAEHPEIYRQYVKTTASRVLTVRMLKEDE